MLLKVPGFVKTSLAPGSRVVSDYLDRAGLTPYLEALGFRDAVVQTYGPESEHGYLIRVGRVALERDFWIAEAELGPEFRCGVVQVEAQCAEPFWWMNEDEGHDDRPNQTAHRVPSQACSTYLNSD